MNDKKTNGKFHHINIFIIHSPLQYLISEYIVRYLEGDTQNYLFLYKSPKKRDIMLAVHHKYWTFVGEILSPRAYPFPRVWGRYKRIISNMQYVADQLPSNSRGICLHINSIKNTHYNFFINYLRYRFPDSEFCIRLLMGGVGNIACRSLSPRVRLRQSRRKLLRLGFPELNYYCFKGDVIGIDASIVDRLYLFKGLPNEYSPEKIYYLPLDKEHREIQKKNQQILVLGNPASKDLCHKMLNWARIASDGKEIIYKPHPSEQHPPLLPENCRLASFSEPLEVHLMNNYYPMIIGAASTGLITARWLCGKQSRIISYGNNYLRAIAKTRHKRIFEKIDNVFYKMNIECIQTQDE